MNDKRKYVMAAGLAACAAITLVLTTAIPLHSNNAGKWPYCGYQYVKAYLYNLENNLYGNHAIVKGNTLDSTVVGDGVTLSQTQAQTLVTLTNKDIRGLIQGLSKSYIPHHGFVFYDKEDQPIAYITLCFDCEAIRVWPEIREGPEKQRAAELSNREIKLLLKILEQYKQLVLDLKLPVLNTPFEYKRMGVIKK